MVKRTVRTAAVIGSGTWLLIGLMCGLNGLSAEASEPMPAEASVVELPADGTNEHYVGNRPPLTPNPLIKLPVGAIRPAGWLRRQLELEANGYTGNLGELSRFLKKEGNAWLSPDGKGHSGWEEVPYWLRGFANLGYVLGDQRIIREAEQWIDAIIRSQRSDGYFGPRDNLTRIQGTPDVWPNMIVLATLQSYYEFTGDERVLELMRRYFRWQLQLPDSHFLLPFWQQQRASDNLLSVYWLYNHTGDPWLLDLGTKIFRNMARWDRDIASWHGVNITQCFRAPAVYYQQSRRPEHLQAAIRNYTKVMSIYGQMPGGMFAADENCRPGYTDPRQAAETCSMAEYMRSHEIMLAITGDPVWADRCEDVAFNSLPASMTADLRALHYLTAANQAICDGKDHSPGVQNRGPMFLFDPYKHRCCQHNAGFAWPYFAQHLWMATLDNGLAAVLYAPNVVTARVAGGTTVQIETKTRYPFEEELRAVVRPEKPVEFPIYLRIPGWCRDASVAVNGRRVLDGIEGGRYVRLVRTWKKGDTIELVLPMRIRVHTWHRNQNAVSVYRGPLAFALRIEERYVRAGGTERWPAWEVHPGSAWNYALVLNEADPASSFEVVRKEWPHDDQPFSLAGAPLELKATGKRVPEWQLDKYGLVAPLQPSPVWTEQPAETIRLVPMGAARLRIAAFPVAGDGPDSHRWEPPAR